MEILATILLMIVVGAIAGVLARFLVPGNDPMGMVATVILGIVGALVGGLLFSLLGLGGVSLTQISWVNLLGATIGAIIALLVYRAVTGNKTRARL